MTAFISQLRGIDVERMVMLPILVFFLVLNSAGLWAGREGIDSANKALDLIYLALVSAFYFLLIILLVVRAPSTETDGPRRAVWAAYAGTFAPFLLIVETGEGPNSNLLLVMANTTMVLGLAFTIYGVTYLGRSFGVVPAARVLVRGGPYKYVRHPLYVGESVTFAGAVMASLTQLTVVVLGLGIALQIYRAVQEERVLSQAFPDYEAYMSQTSRFIPGVV